MEKIIFLFIVDDRIIERNQNTEIDIEENTGNNKLKDNEIIL